ncbi:hypothetical protein R1sor_020753 [Riccia sorocarpa]|uniref:Uncharacterized protein n=1 Tax=Riccia sorocarpa TaxID=122646 RepID=A0ABD3GHZ9_9MARC
MPALAGSRFGGLSQVSCSVLWFFRKGWADSVSAVRALELAKDECVGWSLKVRGYNTRKAAKHLKVTLAWRQTYDIVIGRLKETEVLRAIPVVTASLEVMMDLIGDIYDERRGESAQKHDKMVLRYFTEFSGGQITDLINKSSSELKEVFGRFANFLFMKKEQTGVPGWQTAMNYLSALSQVFKRVLFSKQQGIFADAEWYNGVRGTLAKKYVSFARASGEPLVESPDPLTDELLLEVCKFLYEKNTCKSMKDRGFLVNRWHLFGRVSEVSYLRNRFLDFSSSAGALLLDMIRMKGTKIGKPTRYSLFVHHDSWMKCVLHAMGSSFILNQETSKEDDYCYPDIPRGEKVSSYINGVLRDFTGSMKGRANLTSHSGRHGAAAEADCNQTVNVTWIIERGEWVVDRINIAFEYIFGNSRNDRRVARVLAGWPDSSAGGLPPLLQDLDHPTLPATLSSLAEDLFSQTLPLALKEMLLAVQLYRFEDVYQYNPNHILVSTIAEHAAINGLSVADLISIGQKLFTSFQRRNLGQLSVEESPDNISGRLNRLTEVQLEVRVELNQQLDEIRRELRQATRMVQEEVKISVREEVKHLKNALLSEISEKALVNPEATSCDMQIEDMVEIHTPREEARGSKRSFPSHLQKLGGLSLADAYFEFVRWGLSDCTTSGKKEYDAWIDLRQLYTFARRLEPLFCEVSDPPSFHGEEFHEWRAQVRPVIQEAAQKLQKKIEEFHEQNKVVESVSRERKPTDKALASLKRMRAMVGEK